MGGGEFKPDVKTGGSTQVRHVKQRCLSVGGAGGIPCVGVKGEDIRRNTGGEGGFMEKN